MERVLERVAELAVAHVPGAEEVSVTLLEEAGAHTAASSGGLAASLDERQYRLRSGPCLDAAQSGRVVRIDDTTNDVAYPDFSAVAARQGVRSVVSVGMQVPQRVLGAVNVYCSEDEALDAGAEQLLQVFAGCAAVALANHSLYASAQALGEDMRAAMASRAVIEQATGVLVAALRCTPAEAFADLARRSQQAERGLREVAVEIVQRAGRG
nr:GAF and ANTAR domain-containing protein [Kineococcus vitellinus]